MIARPRSWQLPRTAPTHPPSTAHARAESRPLCSPAPMHADRDARDRALAAWLKERGVRLVVLAGYMAMLGEEFLASFPGAVINVHPSLLPAFPGAHAIDDALAYGVKVFGVTVHFVDAGVDTGPVILQRPWSCRTRQRRAGARRAPPVRHELLPRAVALFAAGAINADPQDPRRISLRRRRLRSETVDRLSSDGGRW